MLSSIQLCFKHKGRVDGKKTLVFQPGLNVVIGPNGSGKSSLLAAIHHCPKCVRQDTGSTQYHYFNSETMNPHRAQAHLKGTSAAVIRVRAMFSSHGETMRDVLSSIHFRPGDCLLLDEPEAGQDLRWVVKIRRGLDKVCRTGTQVIIATHHPVFWQADNMIELKRNYLQTAVNIFRKQLPF